VRLGNAKCPGQRAVLLVIVTLWLKSMGRCVPSLARGVIRPVRVWEDSPESKPVGESHAATGIEG
jgi:hypothetical protein